MSLANTMKRNDKSFSPTQLTSLGVIFQPTHLVRKYAYDYRPLAPSVFIIATLTHLSLSPHICVSELGQHWHRQWLAACSAPSHYLNQCWFELKWTLRKFESNTWHFIHENALDNVVCEMVAILSRRRWVKLESSVIIITPCRNPYRTGPVYGSVQDCSISSASAMEIRQPCIK